ncbi:formin-binding protein 1 homolog isoform X2 [Petromyzon marinus]|uniref:formin-binding protein 1 homolog isoform X2 n=1 Tax=Petromyzon marinus TaxID=7757 RepID=UPI003F6E8E0C
MSWGVDLWDQFDNVEKHTQWGIDFLEKYCKFVKERTEIETNYAKQLRNLTKKYQSKKTSKEEDENRFSVCRAFVAVLTELNDYAGQHEVIAENMNGAILREVLAYVQELKQERKTQLNDGRKAQQHLEGCWKQLESSKKKFERECKEAERALQHFEKMDNDINVTKADVEKARTQSNQRMQMAEDCKSEYAAQLQKFNEEQHQHYFTVMPKVFQDLQAMDERRISNIAESITRFADIDRQVMPILGKCLDEMTSAAESISAEKDSGLVVEAYKSGFERPGDVDFEDYSQFISRTPSDSSISSSSKPDVSRSDNKPVAPGITKSKPKLWPFGKKHKSPPHLPPLDVASAQGGLSTPGSPNAAGPQSPSSLSPSHHRSHDQGGSKSRMMPSFKSLKRGPGGRPRSDGVGAPAAPAKRRHPEALVAALGRPTHAREARRYLLSMKLSSPGCVPKGVPAEDFSHLPPEQRRKKLQQKIDDLNSEIKKEVDQREALLKMKDVYLKNPQMGDSTSLEPKLSETAHKIDKLQQEAQKFENWLADAEGRMPARVHGPKRNSAAYDRSSIVVNNVVNNGSQDRESPDGSYTEEAPPEGTPAPPAPRQPDPAVAPAHGGGGGTTATTAAQVDSGGDFDDDDFEDEEPLPVLGRCKALYPFDGNSEGTIAIAEEELFQLVEEDKGDGWTRVRRANGEEGYVPTSYLEVTLDPVAAAAAAAKPGS